jgi:hypothetical protein
MGEPLALMGAALAQNDAPLALMGDPIARGDAPLALMGGSVPVIFHRVGDVRVYSGDGDRLVEALEHRE